MERVKKKPRGIDPNGKRTKKSKKGHGSQGRGPWGPVARTLNHRGQGSPRPKKGIRGGIGTSFRGTGINERNHHLGGGPNTLPRIVTGEELLSFCHTLQDGHYSVRAEGGCRKKRLGKQKGKTFGESSKKQTEQYSSRKKGQRKWV